MADDRATKIKKQRVYAKSMLDSAIMIGGKDEALRVRGDLDSILYASLGNAQVAEIFADEIVEYTKATEKLIDRNKIVREIFAGASDAVLDVLGIMAENKDLYLCMSMYDTYNELIEEEFNVVIVDVVTVVELDDKLRSLIKDKAAKEFNSEIVLHEHIDKNILGGVILSARNRILDCSLLTRLEKTRSELTSVHHYG